MALFECHCTVATRVLASADLSHDISILTDVIDNLVAVLQDRSHLHKAMPDEEKSPIFVSDVIEHFVFAKVDRTATGQQNVAEFASEDRHQRGRKRCLIQRRVFGQATQFRVGFWVQASYRVQVTRELIQAP